MIKCDKHYVSDVSNHNIIRNNLPKNDLVKSPTLNKITD